MSKTLSTSGGFSSSMSSGAGAQNISHIESAIKISSLDSTELLKGQKVIEIKHNGAVYRLQVTKLGKLILTK
jgi:hemin uptake protein HemP